ncbi:unnamed protein product [Macrosiphum euphorbiae]|uniref:Uncharacterized protein n=1 Tax=Macrosiphum euphorbiae TaxID=13131 RepID=A0AAV0X7W1_9HEMI|nr:unnamed protein product [Macrosiphum euphorbiae]
MTSSTRALFKSPALPGPYADSRRGSCSRRHRFAVTARRTHLLHAATISKTIVGYSVPGFHHVGGNAAELCTSVFTTHSVVYTTVNSRQYYNVITFS